jgi:sterol desaturase/sphingolipid hydroxylase (fatty acid hydroxylase superfamily)
MYRVLAFDLFLVVTAASAASFCAHVSFDKQYHAEGSSLAHFAWFRRMQELHFIDHLHANSNFGVIHSFWDRLLVTYRSPDPDVRRACY